MPTKIDKLASIHPKANIADGVEIGQFTVVGPDVTIGSNTRIGPNCLVTGKTTIGEENVISGLVSLGTPPQDLASQGEVTELIIGDHNVFREFAQVNCGTAAAGGRTAIGNDNFILGQTHIAHDCDVGNNCILSNIVMLAGHVRVESNVIISGMVGIHQFATVGTRAFIAGMSRIPMDVPPFMIVEGRDEVAPRSVNIIGLKRSGFSGERINALRRAHKLIWRSDFTPTEALDVLEDEPDVTEDVKYLVAFLRRQAASRFGRTRELERAP